MMPLSKVVHSHPSQHRNVQKNKKQHAKPKTEEQHDPRRPGEAETKAKLFLIASASIKTHHKF